MDWRFVLSLLFALIVAIFAIQNAGAVDIKFLSMHASVSQALVILISATFGAVTVLLLSVIRSLKLRSKAANEARKVEALEREKEQLKQNLNQYNAQSVSNIDKEDKPED